MVEWIYKEWEMKGPDSPWWHNYLDHTRVSSFGRTKLFIWRNIAAISAYYYWLVSYDDVFGNLYRQSTGSCDWTVLKSLSDGCLLKMAPDRLFYCFWFEFWVLSFYGDFGFCSLWHMWNALCSLWSKWSSRSHLTLKKVYWYGSSPR